MEQFGRTVTVVIPTYCESENLRPLVKEIYSVIDPQEFIVDCLFVDDNSRDGSLDVIKDLQNEGFKVNMIVRDGPRDLSKAVLNGFQRASGERLVCMDGDLQHPPSIIPHLLRALSPNKPFAIASRYAGETVDIAWPLHRRVISFLSCAVAWPLTDISDPMTGFFAVTKDLVNDCTKLNPIGFKIGLELIVKNNLRKGSITEVPFRFRSRQKGSSKLNPRISATGLIHLMFLYAHVGLLQKVLPVFLIIMVTVVGYLLMELTPADFALSVRS